MRAVIFRKTIDKYNFVQRKSVFSYRVLFHLMIAALVAGVLVFPAAAFGSCDDGVQVSGALYQICLPDAPVLWNGDLVVFAHGYVSIYEDLTIPDYEVEGTSIADLITQLGYAYATTSFRANGLIVPEAIEDLLELVDIFVLDYGEPTYVYLSGASEGGLITTQAIEKYPAVFDGGLGLCGPLGDFAKQINYIGDFRVVFDYFFPGVLPAWNPEDPYIPDDVIAYWDTFYVPRIIVRIASNPDETEQLLRVTRAPYDSDDLTSIGQTVLGLLWYNVFGTNDAMNKLGGQPFDNGKRIYIGSSNDLRLNLRVKRFTADQAALDKIEASYQTSGDLVAPLVTMHTTKDEIVPYWHELVYWWKVFRQGAGLYHTNIPIFRYGHCDFTVNELLAGFGLLVFKVNHMSP